jgi:hypothetical protein
MKAENAKLKVSFYLKRNVFRDGMNPVQGLTLPELILYII